MIKTDLSIIEAQSGSVMHFLKETSGGFNGFGEVYFSSVKYNSVKAWKLHKKMTLNLVVPVGKVLFCFFDARAKSKTLNKTFNILFSQDPYFRLTVPPGIWFGFKGLSAGLNLICNVVDIPYDPEEILRKEISELSTDWDLI